MDIASAKEKLNSRIKLFTWIGGISAIFAIIPLIWAGIQVIQVQSFFKENELGDFIGGTSGTFASFAGLAFVYVGFLGQQLQILMQQEELEMNRKEMQATRLEIQGQKRQLELQNKQFENQLFETTFFNLINVYKTSLSTSIRPSWEVDLNRKLNSALIVTEPDGTGGYQQIGPTKSFDEIPIEVIIEAIMTFPFDLILGFREAIEPVIAILLHIQHKEKTHHLTTLLYSIPKRDKVIFIYYYIAQKDHLTKTEKALVKELLLIFPEEIFKSNTHKLWIEKS